MPSKSSILDHHPMDDSDISDSYLDEDLKKMSAAAMSALESIQDEVDAIEKKGKGHASDDEKPVVSEQKKGTAKNSKIDIMGPASTEETDPDQGESQSSLKHIDDTTIPGDDEDHDSLSLDGSIMGELDALRTVALEIERELKDQDGHTMQKAIDSLESSDDPKKRVLTSDDQEIIRRVLLDEMKKYEAKNAWERFVKRYHLEGFNERDKIYALSTACVVIWSVVIRLLYKVSYGQMI
mmetsp:Transcript_88799/g.256101  ORF Transcript_88799/g.256101 Transcript_88799/m.256101 type:complete len:238 (-) Transcript_88799:314-1027(-)